MAGLFIAFEGGEGAGKSTQAGILHCALQEQGYDAALLREPGSTELGDYLRQYLIGGRPVSAPAELLMFEAARAQLMTERILPLLDDGAVVIADRFAGSTVAYQGYGRGVELGRVKWLNDFATGGRYPDLSILLDIDPLIGLGRVNSRQLRLSLLMNDGSDRFEDETVAFHHAVHQGFRRQANLQSDTWRIIEGNRSIDAVAAAVWATALPLLDWTPNAPRRRHRESISDRR